jgi:hypothetical protein
MADIDFEGLLLSVDAALMQMSSVRRQVLIAMGANLSEHEHEPVEVSPGEWYCGDVTCAQRIDAPDGVGVSSGEQPSG